MSDQHSAKIASAEVDPYCFRNFTIDVGEIPRPCAVDRIILPDDVARDFLVTDVKVGRLGARDSQFYGTGCLPASIFSESSVVRNRFDVVQAGTQIVLSVTNKRAERRTFGGVVTFCEVGNQHQSVALGLGSTLVVAGGSCRVNVQPQVEVLFQRLVVASEVAPLFEVLDVAVGKQSLSIRYPSAKACDETRVVETYSPRQIVVTPSMFVTVEVRNVSDCAVNFQGAVACAPLQPARW